MCGIIGVSGIVDAARVTYLGLYALQHRGQESAGIVAVDASGHGPHCTARMGLVSDAFDEEAPRGCRATSPWVTLGTPRPEVRSWRTRSHTS